jgi:hypothetical protein
VTIATLPDRLIAAPLLAVRGILPLGMGCSSVSMRIQIVENVNGLS